MQAGRCGNASRQSYTRPVGLTTPSLVPSPWHRRRACYWWPWGQRSTCLNVHPMANPSLIRPARLDDIRECLALATRAGAAAPTCLAADVQDPDRQLLVAECGGRVAGYGRAMRFRPAAGAPADSAPAGYYLVGLVVDADLRRRGLGSALTRRRLAWIKERAGEAWYFANAGNAVSIALHARFGFSEVTRAFSFPDVTFDGDGILFRAELRNAPLAPQPRTP